MARSPVSLMHPLPPVCGAGRPGSRPGTPSTLYAGNSTCTLSRPSTQSRPDSRRHLARAGWNILGTPQLKDPPTSAPELEAEGARLVAQLASAWCGKYSYMIRNQGAQGESFHYECMFSQPTNEAPVPSIIVRAMFALVAPQDSKGQLVQTPRLVFSFEEADLRQEWSLERSSHGHLRVVQGQQKGTVREAYFEKYLDKYIFDKEVSRGRGVNLVTDFEATRLEKPPIGGSTDSESSDTDVSSETLPIPGQFLDRRVSRRRSTYERSSTSITVSNAQGMNDAEADMSQALRTALKVAGIAGDKVPPPSSLSELLANVFDAADEEDAGELPHCEVARLLSATLAGFDLELWDIQLLLTVAHENEAGLIECKPFIQAAPELIQELRRRRLAYKARGKPGCEVSSDAIKFCFGSEVFALESSLFQAFSAYAEHHPNTGFWQADEFDSSILSRASIRSGSKMSRRQSKRLTYNFGGRAGGSKQSQQPPALPSSDWPEGFGEKRLVGLTRMGAHECIQSAALSPQEAQRLMQMLPENDAGFVLFEEITDTLEEMRSGAMLNALVESDVSALRKHLVLRFRHVGIPETGKLKVWHLKQALLQADQICLSLQQIFVLLCLAHSATDEFGNVDVAAYLGTLCVVIPHMFDAKGFMATADRLQAEAAELQRLKENAEIAALGTSKVMSLGQDEEQTNQEKAADPDTVDKSLISLFQSYDDLKRNHLPASKIYTLLRSGDALVQNCQLSDPEISGLAAELIVDEAGEVAYAEHVKRVVPMIFALRDNCLYSEYVKDDAFEKLSIPTPNFAALDKICPILPLETIDRSTSKLEAPGGDESELSDRKVTKRRNSRRSTGSSRRSFSDLASTAQSKPLGDGAPPAESEEPGSFSKARARLSIVGSRSLVNLDKASELHSNEPPKGRGYERRKLRLSSVE